MVPPRRIAAIGKGKQPAVPDRLAEEAAHLETPTPVGTQDPIESIERDGPGEGLSIRDILNATPSKDRFLELANQYRTLEDENQMTNEELHVMIEESSKSKEVVKRLTAERDRLTTERERLTAERDRLIEERNQATAERDEAIAHRDIAARERGDLAYRLLNLQNEPNRARSDTPSMGVTPQKSTKMPDAPMLKDGKEVRFETWETVIRQKLEANADHYPLPVHRKLYVQSRCEGKAQLHIAPRMSATSTNPYADAEDIIVHLRTVFANPNRRAEAYTAYHKLKMKPKDDFTDFLAEFMQLAEEAAVVEENRKRDLYSKLPFLLQGQVMWAVNQDTVAFDAFTQSCQSMAHEISLQQEAKSARTRTATSFGSGSGATTSTASQSYTPRVKREGAAPGLSASERDNLMKEGRCFYCKEKGHMTFECPKKKSNAAAGVAATTTQPRTQSRVTEIEELEDDTDQGKATA